MARHRHRLAQATDQVGSAVGCHGRAVEHHLEWSERGDVLEDPAGQLLVEGRHRPDVAACGGVARSRQWRTQHHCIGPAHHRRCDVAGCVHAGVCDHVAVHTGLVQVAHPGGAGIRDRRGLGTADPEHLVGGRGDPGTHAHEHAGGARAHQVQRGRVAGAAAHEHRHVEAAHQVLEVERFHLAAADVLGRGDGAADHQHVWVRCGYVGQQGLGPGRTHGHRGHCARILDLGDAGSDQVGIHRGGVCLAQFGRPVAGLQRGQAFEDAQRVGVAGPQPLDVQHTQAPQAIQLDGHRRTGHPVERRGEDRDVELVGVDLPAHVDVIRVAGPTARQDAQFVQGISPPRLLSHPDIYLCHRVAPISGPHRSAGPISPEWPRGKR